MFKAEAFKDDYMIITHEMGVVVLKMYIQGHLGDSVS